MSEELDKLKSQTEKTLKRIEEISVPSAPIELKFISESTHLVARTREEMAECQSALSQWLDRKIETEKQSQRELQENFELAIKNKWRAGTLKKHAQLAKHTVIYYEKMKAAVDQGYAIIPDLPATVFAIRVDDDGIPPVDERHQSPTLNLPQGEGEYVSADAIGYDKEWTTGREGVDLHRHWKFIAEAYDKVAFPLVAVKPEIMKESGEAMKKKIFDSISVFLPKTSMQPQRPSSGVRYADPMILGRIIAPKRYPYEREKACCFLIAWFLDLRTL